jgi:hypothetical protein
VVIANLNRFVEQIIKKLVLDIVANLQAAPSEGGTPVDTGWARANWVPNIGSALDTTAGTRAQAEAGQLSTASAAGVAQVAIEYKLARGAVHITNNVPYILLLDAGSSTQAPAGFVRRGILKALRVDLIGGFGR